MKKALSTQSSVYLKSRQKLSKNYIDAVNNLWEMYLLNDGEAVSIESEEINKEKKIASKSAGEIAKIKLQMDKGIMNVIEGAMRALKMPNEEINRFSVVKMVGCLRNPDEIGRMIAMAVEQGVESGVSQGMEMVGCLCDEKEDQAMNEAMIEVMDKIDMYHQDIEIKEALAGTREGKAALEYLWEMRRIEAEEEKMNEEMKEAMNIK